MTRDFLLYLNDIDLAAFRAINDFCGRSFLLDHIANRLDNPQLKGLVFMTTFGALWFRYPKARVQERETLILTLFGVVIAIAAARGLADLLPFRSRPLYEAGYHPALFQRFGDYEDWSSFPSDNAALVFALTTGFWQLSRVWGILWACFGVTTMLARIYFGIHYPGDVLAGALIGIGVTLAINNAFMHARLASPIVMVEQRAPAIFYALLFPLIYEISTLFWFTRSIRYTLWHLWFGFGT